MSRSGLVAGFGLLVAGGVLVWLLTRKKKPSIQTQQAIASGPDPTTWDPYNLDFGSNDGGRIVSVRNADGLFDESVLVDVVVVTHRGADHSAAVQVVVVGKILGLSQTRRDVAGVSVPFQYNRDGKAWKRFLIGVPGNRDLFETVDVFLKVNGDTVDQVIGAGGTR